MESPKRVKKVHRAKGVKSSMPARPLNRIELFPNSGHQSELSWVPDWQMLKVHLCREGKVWKEDFVKLVQQTNRYLSKRELSKKMMAT